jgi:hypothetical protein
MDNSEVIYRLSVLWYILQSGWTSWCQIHNVLFLFVGFPRQIYFDVKIDYYNDDKREVK